MGKEVVLSEAQLPAHLANRVGAPSALAQSMTGGIGTGVEFPRISIKGARFRIVEGDAETLLDSTTIEVVIVGANPRLSKQWYAKAWNPDAEATAPDCFSLDGISPDAAAEDPQNDLCSTCEHNAWGSRIGTNGQQLKACSDGKRLAVVAADDPEGSVYLLTVTPAALKGLNQYQKELSMRGIPPEIVKTKVSFDTDASFPKLKFGFAGFLDEETQMAVDKLFGTEQVMQITGELTSKPVAQLPSAAPKAKAPAVQVKAKAPVVEPEPEPPVKTKGFGGGKKVTPAKAAPAKSAEPAEPANTAGDALADEIAALVGGQQDDE